MRPPSLANLCNELLLEIAEHLESERKSTSTKPTSLKNLSLVNRHFRWLLKSLVMGSIVLTKQPDYVGDEPYNWYQPRVVWKRMREAIRFLSEDPNTLANIRKLQFEMPKYFYIYTANHETRPFDDIRQFLTGLPDLEHLHVQIPKDRPSWDHDPRGLPYSREYARKIVYLVPSLGLGNVATLVIDLSMVTILKHCPRVQHLGLLNHCDSHRLDDIGLHSLAKFAPNVSHVEARSRWLPREIQCLARTWPNLHHLGIFTNETMVPKLDTLLRDLGTSFNHLKVLKLADLYMESFWADGLIRLNKLFRASGNISVHWINSSKELELPWASFLREHAGHKLMKDVMESVFCNLIELDECRIGDVMGARRVWGDEPSDYSEEWIDAAGDDDLDRQKWTLRFNWLEHAELCGPVEGKQGGDWLLRPV